jgi:hypothetical protein
MNNRIFARMENDYSKLATSYEVASLKYNQLYRDNETYLYTEGLSKLNPLKNKTSDVEVPEDNEENSKISDAQITEKSNIIKKIIDWFKKVFRSIKEKIRKMMKPREDKTQKVEVSKEVLDDIKEIKEYYQRTQTSINQLGTGDVEKAANYLNDIPLPSSVDSSRNSSSTSGSTTNISLTDRDKLVADLDKINSIMEKSIDKTEQNTLKTVDQKKKTGFKSVAINILNIVNSVLGKIRKVVLKTATIISILVTLTVAAGATLYATNRSFRKVADEKIEDIQDKFYDGPDFEGFDFDD